MKKQLFILIFSILFVFTSVSCNNKSLNVSAAPQNTKGTILVEDARGEAKKSDVNEINFYNGEKIDFYKFNSSYCIGWFDSNTVVLWSNEKKLITLLNLSNKNTKTIKPNLANDSKDILSVVYKKGKIFFEKIIDTNTRKIYSYNLNNNSEKFITSLKSNSAFDVLDDEGKYILTQTYSIDSTPSKPIQYTNFVSTILDTKSNKSIVIKEDTLLPDDLRPIFHSQFMAITYSKINNKFYSALKNKIYEFTFDSPIPKVIKDTGDLDISNENFMLRKGDVGLLLECENPKDKICNGYYFDFETRDLNLIAPAEFRKTANQIYSFYYNYEKDLLFTQSIDKSTNILHPIIGEIHKNKFTLKAKLFTTESLATSLGQGYSAFWSDDGSKLLLTVFSSNQDTMCDSIYTKLVEIK